MSKCKEELQKEIEKLKCKISDLEKEYNSPKDAEKGGYSLKQISAVYNGRQKSHKGKIWKFKK